MHKRDIRVEAVSEFGLGLGILFRVKAKVLFRVRVRLAHEFC